MFQCKADSEPLLEEEEKEAERTVNSLKIPFAR